MILPFNYEIEEKYKIFKLVNENDEKLKKLGLKPLDIKLYPLYINLNGHIYYGGNSHYNCKLSNDIKYLLSIMNSNQYDRFNNVHGFLNDDYTVNYYIHDGNIYFTSNMSLYAYENFPTIREIIKEKYHVNDAFYKPTSHEILTDYYIKMIGKERIYREAEYININLSPKEFFDYIMTLTKKSLELFTDSNQLTGEIIRIKLNYNANLFMEHILPWNETGVYNNECMELINNYQETKRNIHESLYSLSMKSSNMQEMVVELLKTTSSYHEIKKQTREQYLEDPYYERTEWDQMFFNAHPDILVCLVGFDKIETMLPKTIATSKLNINETFFNYLIMDYNIVTLPRIIYDRENNNFKMIKPNPYYQTETEREYEEEIKLIKKYIPYDERSKHFK